jgi:hypothetical protein
MTTQQAYINGFIKRASEYGYSESQAIEILKQAADPLPVNTGTAAAAPAPINPGTLNAGQPLPQPKTSIMGRLRNKFLGGFGGGISTSLGKNTNVDELMSKLEQ